VPLPWPVDWPYSTRWSRADRRVPLSRQVAYLCLFAAAFTIGLMLIDRHEDRVRDRLRSSGQRSVATVLAITERSRSDDVIAVRGRFDTATGPVTETIGITPPFSPPVGSRFAVVYDPQRPATVWVADRVDHGQPSDSDAYLVVTSLFVVAFGVTLLLRPGSRPADHTSGGPVHPDPAADAGTDRDQRGM
jgi:hypothetical protein